MQRLIIRAGSDLRPSDTLEVGGLINRRRIQLILKKSKFCHPHIPKKKKAIVGQNEKEKKAMRPEDISSEDPPSLDVSDDD